MGLLLNLFVPLSLVYCDILCNMTDYLFYRQWMTLWIVLYKIHTEIFSENYIFCVRSNIQIDNKSDQTPLLCCLLCNVISDTLPDKKADLPLKDIWLNDSPRKGTRKLVCSAPWGVCISGKDSPVCTDEMFVSLALSAEKLAEMWNEISLSRSQVISQYYSEEQAQPLRVALDQLELVLHSVRKSLRYCWNCNNNRISFLSSMFKTLCVL